MVYHIFNFIFSSCLIIGSIDGGLFATPSIVGILGLYLVYRNGYYLNYIIGRLFKDENLLKENENINPPYRNRGFNEIRYLFNRFAYLIPILLIILLRFTVAFAGAEPDYYTVNIANPENSIDLGNINEYVLDCDNASDKIIYKIDHRYNEMKLLNDLRIPLNNSCEYYTVSWNIYSYLEWYHEKIYLILPLLAGLMFGSSGIFVRTLTQNGIDSTTLLFLRFSIAIIPITIAILLTDRDLFRLNLTDIPHFCFVQYVLSD